MRHIRLKLLLRPVDALFSALIYQSEIAYFVHRKFFLYLLQVRRLVACRLGRFFKLSALHVPGNAVHYAAVARVCAARHVEKSFGAGIVGHRRFVEHTARLEHVEIVHQAVVVAVGVRVHQHALALCLKLQFKAEAVFFRFVARLHKLRIRYFAFKKIVGLLVGHVEVVCVAPLEFVLLVVGVIRNPV